MEISRKWGMGAVILFPLIDRGTLDFESTPISFVAGDCQISKNENAFANTNSLPAHRGNGTYSLTLTASEMAAKRIVITVIDSATKTWEDQAILVTTYGNANAEHGFDLDLPISLVALSPQGKLDVNAEADIALADYDTPTKDEMDTAHALLSTLAAQTTIDAIVDAIKAVTDNLPNSGSLTNLDAAISSRSSHGDPDPSGFIDAAISSRSSHGDPTGNAMALTAAAINAIWDELTAEARTADSYGQLIKDNIDAPISGATAPDENVIADAVLSRPISNVEPAAFRTLYGAIASLVNRSRINNLNQLEIYKVDDTTILVTIPGTVDSALLPIRELNPP